MARPYVHTPYELTPRAAISAHRRGESDAPTDSGELSADDLLRALLGHPSWRVPTEVRDGRDAIGVLVRPDGGRILELFSDDQALATFSEREPDHAPSQWRALPGYSIFAHADDAFTHRVNIDVYSEHAFRYQHDQLPLLRAWSHVVMAELALYDPERFANPFAVLRRVPEWRLLLRVDGEQRDWVFAPDRHGRSLAAVFTASDTIDAFIDAVGDQLDGTLEIVTQTGDELFGALQQLPIDGLVVNPLGPLPPRALSIGVAEQVLRTAP